MRVLVTGAASGIGRATCLRLARDASNRGETGQVAAVDREPSAALAFLLSPRARYLNGHDPVVDGGVSGNFLGRLPGLTQVTRA